MVTQPALLRRLRLSTRQPQSLAFPADYTAECSDDHPMEAATATDNCGEVVITVEEITTAGACAGDYVITRTFTATDDCGNSTCCYSDDH